MVKENRGR